MTVKLPDIIPQLEIIHTSGDLQREITEVVFDSRKAGPGSLFVAVPGTRNDGHAFIPDVFRVGCSVVIGERMPEEIPAGACFIQVKDSAQALGLVSSAFYGHPSRRFKLVGITGTNGKTTTITLLHKLSLELGYQSGCFTTIRNYIGRNEMEATHTTPDPVQLNARMKDMADAGCQFVFMEVSSHALVQQRVAGLTFAGGIFSNITHDHLDYHKTFDEYLRAKKLFFDQLPSGSFACINADDRNGKVMVQNTRASVHYYGLRSMADFKGKILESHMQGTLMIIDDQEIWTRFLGEFNAYNLLAVYGTARLLGFAKDEVLRVLSLLETVEGRFQYLRSDSGVTAIIDYAHTPDALLNVLKTIGKLRKGKEKVISVVGAGGNRDKTKRPEMARVAASLSDTLVLTADNPRDEEPGDIIDDMLAGINEPSRNRTLVQPDRREAIRTACLMAQPGDIVLIAGKGHETYQEIKGIKYPFSDREIVSSIFGTTSINP